MKKKISIEGMSCGHCVKHVTEALKEVKGVSNVEVSLENKNALIEASEEVKDGDIKFAVEDAGYDVTEIASV
ncbi:heavy-metal-associated domain-containing protein [Clostridium sp. 19966]|uniref:heavy-metal-associated domain-containing protein n=1 Tax=Clostridium sp. 19966 TaxID=2768166 RepID=UPI0028DF9E14|nr:copper ion binding protein [Clostridium sp. 19966]MDT8716012.1 heavy-metal-associated domain-containing protein [Clostridium sp. 19966]